MYTYMNKKYLPNDYPFDRTTWFPLYSNGTLYLRSIRRDIGYYLRQGTSVDTKILYKSKQDALIECARRNRSQSNQPELKFKED